MPVETESALEPAPEPAPVHEGTSTRRKGTRRETSGPHVGAGKVRVRGIGDASPHGGRATASPEAACGPARIPTTGVPAVVP